MSSGETYLSDPEAALDALSAVATRAGALTDRLASLVSRIDGLEGGKPWGSTAEYGKPFESQYLAEPGAAFVKEQAQNLARTTEEGADLARRAVQATIESDSNASTRYTGIAPHA
ncbi:hypothetical protein [Kineosporia babensis]|uniref:Uncharacterized protein n=1 Tax=Kineosporia babensis TaxID=499548 RepID=A0A9X1NA25_9ACTN|nr:hypothetical protein [Kineosporia babensis]MCD5309991.1 hypothetical protein [Kineosporia babensis]